MNRNSWLVIAVAALSAVALFLSRGFWGDAIQSSKDQGLVDRSINDGKRREKVSSNVSNAPAPSLKLPRSELASTSGGITYLPGVRRELKVIPGKLEMNSKNPRWWLYARSPEDAAWLDKHGYPTPSEEARLEAASDADLKTLAQNGDLNAKVHLAGRGLKAAFRGTDLIKAETASGELVDMVVEYGPYAASKSMVVLREVAKEYYRVPESERTEYQKKVLREYSISFEMAYATALAYGEYTADFFHDIPLTQLDTGISEKDITGASIARHLSNVSRNRIAMGLPPITLDPRPQYPLEGESLAGQSVPRRETTSVVIERQ